MSDERQMMVSTAEELLADLCTPEAVRAAETTGWDGLTWTALTEADFHLVGVAEAAGGSGGDLADACALLEVAGRHALPLPLAEHGMLGAWALTSSGLDLGPGVITVAPGRPDDEVSLEQGRSGWRLRATLHRVPWAEQATTVVLLARPDGGRGPVHVVSLPRAVAELHTGKDMAGQPRDTVVVNTDIGAHLVSAAPDGVDHAAWALRGKLSRCAMTAGALDRVAQLTNRYTGERQQFGRPVARFQAVQSHLVRIAEQAQAARVAQRTAALNGVTRLDLFDVAAAAVVSGEAASVVAAAAHQAHGAIGMTREYELAQLTRRLWTWRDEYGSERVWARRLGEAVSAAGADALWPRIAQGRHL